jgi:hypothetical protein
MQNQDKPSTSQPKSPTPQNTPNAPAEPKVAPRPETIEHYASATKADTDGNLKKGQ